MSFSFPLFWLCQLVHPFPLSPFLFPLSPLPVFPFPFVAFSFVALVPFPHRTRSSGHPALPSPSPGCGGELLHLGRELLHLGPLETEALRAGWSLCLLSPEPQRMSRYQEPVLVNDMSKKRAIVSGHSDEAQGNTSTFRTTFPQGLLVTVCTQYTNFATELSTHVWVFFRSKRRILTEILQCRAPPCCTLPFSLLWPIEHQVVPETMPGQESLDEPVIVLASAIDNGWSTVQLLLKSSRRSDPQFLTVERVH